MKQKRKKKQLQSDSTFVLKILLFVQQIQEDGPTAEFNLRLVILHACYVELDIFNSFSLQKT